MANPTHLIGHFSKGGTRTLCGLPVHQLDIARSGQPTCPECHQIDEQDAASLLALQQDTTPIPPPIPNNFDPCAGYRPKGAR